MTSRKGSSRNLHTQVVENLGESIVGGVFQPGDPLPGEAQLANELAVSRTVLREALKVLAAKGLIETRQKTGMAMTPGTSPSSSRSMCPRDRPSRRSERPRIMKSCTAPANTTPTRIQRVPGR